MWLKWSCCFDILLPRLVTSCKRYMHKVLIFCVWTILRHSRNHHVIHWRVSISCHNTRWNKTKKDQQMQMQIEFFFSISQCVFVVVVVFASNRLHRAFGCTHIAYITKRCIQSSGTDWSGWLNWSVVKHSSGTTRALDAFHDWHSQLWHGSAPAFDAVGWYCCCCWLDCTQFSFRSSSSSSFSFKFNANKSKINPFIIM